MGNILGLDVGLKKIGLAIGDRASGFAWPRPALLVEAWSAAWPPLLKLINEENIETIVVGMPYDATGKRGPQAELVQKFVTELQAQVAMPIVTRSERSTTQAVQREQLAAGRKLKRGEEDSLAAQLILEGFLQEPTT